VNLPVLLSVLITVHALLSAFRSIAGRWRLPRRRRPFYWRLNCVTHTNHVCNTVTENYARTGRNQFLILRIVCKIFSFISGRMFFVISAFLVVWCMVVWNQEAETDVTLYFHCRYRVSAPDQLLIGKDYRIGSTPVFTE